MSLPLHASLPDRKRDSFDGLSSRLLPTSQNASANVSESIRTRRLQLRNAGFRAAAVPARQTQTPPESLPSAASTTSSTSALLPDAENISPSGTKACDSFRLPSNNSNITREASALQDITPGNSGGSTSRKNTARPRVTSAKFWSSSASGTQEQLSTGDTCDPPPSTQSQVSNPVQRSVLAHASNMSKNRRSLSIETRRYVDHLESELASAQTQLQAMTSPSASREQSSTVRHTKAQLKRLQEELLEWENKYDERVEEALLKHRQMEASLRSRLKTLEEEAEEDKYRVQELQMQLDGTIEKLDATEAANVNLEKRIEIMSELLAASPTKIDLHSQAAGRPRHSRPKSLLPLFPTAQSLAYSPERGSTQHTSPRYSPIPPTSPTNLSYSPEVGSDHESIHSEVSGFTSSSTHTTGTRPKPMRRMRRFGAGSIGPKPLILPSTSHYEQIPSSAPPIDRQDSVTSLPFVHDHDVFGNGSPKLSHRRASSDMSKRPEGHRRGSSFQKSEQVENAESVDGRDSISIRRLRHRSSPPGNISYFWDRDELLSSVFDSRVASGGSDATQRNFSSIGSVVGAAIGRNLLDELNAAQTSSSFDQPSNAFEEIEEDQIGLDEISTPFLSGPYNGYPSSPLALEIDEDPPDHVHSGQLHETTDTTTESEHQASTLNHNLASSKTLGMQSMGSPSTLDSIRAHFSDMLVSPAALARYLIERAYARLRIPRPFLSIQWWLVGVLLGPMVRRRMLRGTSCCAQDAAGADHLSKDSSSHGPGHDPHTELEYGKLYQTPPDSSSTDAASRKPSLVAGKGKKRAPDTSKDLFSRNESCIQHHQRRWKHSPLLWLKFSMTLAIAVGIAFKDGPSSLLKEAMCNCRARSNANWRQARREGVVTPER